MPRIVDHDQRRLEIAKVVSHLVLTGGTDAVTMRGVADACGYSTTVVCHYFRSKHEMLSFTQREAWKHGLGRVRKASDAGKDMLTCLEFALPNTPQRWQDWHCWLAFWGMAPKTKGIQADWHESNMAGHTVFVDLVEKAKLTGEFASDEDVAETATAIQIIVNGIATLVAQDRGAWTPERQRDTLRRQLVRYGYRPRD